MAKELVSRSPASESTILDLLETGLGIADPQEEEIRSIQEHADEVWVLDKILADMISRRAQIGWSTHGHSGIDVNLYAYGYQADNLRGNMENTAIAKFIESVLDVDLAGTTALLAKTAKAWHDKSPPAAVQSNNTIGLAHYHGLDALGSQNEHLYLDSGALGR